MELQLFLTALITCSTGQAACTSYDTPDTTFVSVCDVLHERYREEYQGVAPRIFEVELDGRRHVVLISPFCKSI